MKSMSEKILYLSYDGMTDSLGQSQVLPYLVGLSKKGYSFHLISFEKKERFEKFSTKIQQICDNASIIWHPLSYTSKPPVISTLLDIKRMQKLAFQLHKQHTFHIIHCRSYIPALIGLQMKRKKNTKFVFDMRGFWADERVEGNIWNLSNPIFKLIYAYFKRKEIDLINEANHIITLTHRAKTEIESWKEITANNLRITVIPCCVDLELFNPENNTPEALDLLRKTLAIPSGTTVIGYVGSIGTWYMLDEMLDYFSIFQKENPKSIFLFVTGEPREKIVSLATEKGISAFSIIVTSTTHDQVPLHIALFDLSVFFIRPTYSKMASSPTKQGEIMAMGIPLICNTGVGDTDKVVQSYQSGLLINDFNENEYKNAVQLPIAYNKLETMKGASEFYGLENGIHRYIECYQNLD
jgi:glycosyltransferase involved in cell wall biosynthesis